MLDEITFADFERYFPYAPTALCIKECVRLKAMHGLSCPGPILDVGAVARDQKLQSGLQKIIGAAGLRAREALA